MNNFEDHIFFHNLISLIKQIIIRQSSSGNGHQLGLTFNELLTELNQTLGRLHNNFPPILANQLQQILGIQIDGVLHFETVLGNDGNIYYQVPQNIDGQRLFEYQPFYQHENQNIQLNQNVNLTQNDHNQNRIQENQQTNFDENSLPEDIDELTNEITNTQNRIEELKRKQNYLFRCHQLLQNPDQLEEELQKMEQIIVSLRDVQAMIDEKVKSLVSNINYELSQK